MKQNSDVGTKSGEVPFRRLLLEFSTYDLDGGQTIAWGFLGCANHEAGPLPERLLIIWCDEIEGDGALHLQYGRLTESKADNSDKSKCRK